MNIKLNSIEIEIGKSIANKRYAQNRAKNVKNTLLVKTKKEKIALDIEGVLSEMAFCKIAQIYPSEVFDVGVRSKKNGKDAGDAFYEGIAIDVKSTKTQTGRLISMFDNKDVDYYALMIGEEGKYNLVGLMKSKDLCVKERWGHHGVFKKPCFKAEQNELLSWDKFVKNNT